MKERVIPLSEPTIGRQERNSINKCLDSGFVSSAGPMIADFERACARYMGVNHAIATTSGTAAIHVALHAMGIGPGSRVIVPDLTFVASMNPALYCGAMPVLADVHETNWCLDPSLFELLCKHLAGSGRKPDAVIPVHLYGCVCDMKAISATARRYDIKIIEDATEALGSRISGRQAGTFGHAGCFSFNGNKLITTGGGGMVVTNSGVLARKIRILVNQAKSASNGGYLHGQMGFNYRMSNLAAALGLGQMKRINAILSEKKRFALRYHKAFMANAAIHRHPEIQGVDNSYWMYSIVLSSPERRNRILRRLNENGIQARKFFQPLHRQPYVKDGVWTVQRGRCIKSAQGISDHLSQRGLNLPSSPGMTKKEQDKVIACVLS